MAVIDEHWITPAALDGFDMCHDLEYLLLGDLCELLQEPETPHSRRSLITILDHLLYNLPRQRDLKCEGGSLAEVLEVFPAWKPEINALRGEDLEFNSVLVRLHDRLAHELPWAPLADETRGILNQWMDLLASLCERECRLLETAFSLDLGGEA